MTNEKEFMQIVEVGTILNILDIYEWRYCEKVNETLKRYGGEKKLRAIITKEAEKRSKK